MVNPCPQNLIDVFNNILDESNVEGWQNLQEVLKCI